MKGFYETHNIDPITTECWLDKALKDQGLEYKDGEIVEIPQENEDERIKREIVRYINIHKNDERKSDEWIAWLEKQGQKPTLEEMRAWFMSFRQRIEKL